jgi:DNA-binding HxlR family transcriptional regulator
MKMETFLHIDTCPIRDIVSRLGDKWSLLVLATLHANGTMRFNDIHKSIGDVSQRMLTVTLRSLEADGLISRKIYAEVPPRVEYRLTESGNELMPYLNNLVEWALKHSGNIIQNRREYTNKMDK